MGVTDVGGRYTLSLSELEEKNKSKLLFPAECAGNFLCHKKFKFI